MFRPFPPADRGLRRLGRRLAGTGLAAAALASTSAWGQSAPTAAQKSMIEAFAGRTGLPRGWVVSVKPDIVVAIRDRDGLPTRAPGDKVRLHGEVVDDDAAERVGYRSMRSLVEVNCETRRDRVVEMEVFAEHNLRGSGQKRSPPGGWVQPSEDAYMADVVRAVCRAWARPGPEPIAAEAAPPAASLKPAIVAQAPAVRPTPAPAAPVAQRPPPKPAAVAAAPAPPRPAPPAPERPRGNLTVQVGALDTAADAQRALGALSRLMTSGLRPRVEPARLGERTFHRALIDGFSSRTEAAAFCATVTRSGGSCFIR